MAPEAKGGKMPIWLAPMLIGVAETALTAIALKLVDEIFAD